MIENKCGKEGEVWSSSGAVNFVTWCEQLRRVRATRTHAHLGSEVTSDFLCPGFEGNDVCDLFCDLGGPTAGPTAPTYHAAASSTVLYTLLEVLVRRLHNGH